MRALLCFQQYYPKNKMHNECSSTEYRLWYMSCTVVSLLEKKPHEDRDLVAFSTAAAA